jgi:predicted DNA-binding transcriptional regulator AlpA
MKKRLLDFERTREKLGNRSRSACYEDMKFGRLPKPIKIGRKLYWSEAVIDALIEQLQEASND